MKKHHLLLAAALGALAAAAAVPPRATLDADACYKPAPFWDAANDRWLLWYNGRRQRDEYIGLVVHPGRDLGFPSARK